MPLRKSDSRQSSPHTNPLEPLKVGARTTSTGEWRRCSKEGGDDHHSEGWTSETSSRNSWVAGGARVLDSTLGSVALEEVPLRDNRHPKELIFKPAWTSRSSRPSAEPTSNSATGG